MAVPVATFVGLTAQDWSALGQMLLGVGAIVAGFWALYNYHRTRRYEAARWLQGVFKDFSFLNGSRTYGNSLNTTTRSGPARSWNDALRIVMSPSRRRKCKSEG